MVTGAHYGVSGVWSYSIVFTSMPVSLLTSALLLANEIRDYDEDRDHDIRTLTVRIGLNGSKALYTTTIFLVFPVSFLLHELGQLSNLWWLLPSLLFVIPPLTLVNSHSKNKNIKRLPPLTGRFFMVFGICFILGVIQHLI